MGKTVEVLRKICPSATFKDGIMLNGKTDAEIEKILKNL